MRDCGYVPGAIQLTLDIVMRLFWSGAESDKAKTEFTEYTPTPI